MDGLRGITEASDKNDNNTKKKRRKMIKIYVILC